MRAASFRVAGENGKLADVSVVPLPGLAGGDLDNVNRWRGQVGLKGISQEELAKLAQPVEIDGQPAQLYDQAGENPGSGEKTRILAAITRRDGVAWFFKMTGDDGLVAQQKPAFVEFLKSVTFPANAAQSGLPPSHPPIASSPELPPSHPPIGAGSELPPSHPPIGGASMASPDRPAAASSAQDKPSWQAAGRLEGSAGRTIPCGQIPRERRRRSPGGGQRQHVRGRWRRPAGQCQSLARPARPRAGGRGGPHQAGASRSTCLAPKPCWRKSPAPIRRPGRRRTCWPRLCPRHNKRGSTS